MNWFTKWFRKRRTSGLTEEDYIHLGAKLVGLLSASLESDVPTVECLKRLARNWNPQAKKRVVDLEVFFLHKFLLVQAVALGSSPIVSNNVLWGFYTALEVIIKDHQSPLYVSEFIRSRVETSSEGLEKLERVWLARSKQYEELFALDLKEYSEHRPGHLPWKRTITRFMVILRKPSGETNEALRETEGFIQATVAVATTFAGIYCKNATELISSTLGKTE